MDYVNKRKKSEWEIFVLILDQFVQLSLNFIFFQILNFPPYLEC